MHWPQEALEALRAALVSLDGCKPICLEQQPASEPGPPRGEDSTEPPVDGDGFFDGGEWPEVQPCDCGGEKSNGYWQDSRRGLWWCSHCVTRPSVLAARNAADKEALKNGRKKQPRK